MVLRDRYDLERQAKTEAGLDGNMTFPSRNTPVIKVKCRYIRLAFGLADPDEEWTRIGGNADGSPAMVSDPGPSAVEVPRGRGGGDGSQFPGGERSTPGTPI